MRRRDRGVALVAVLWILAVLAVMAIGYGLAVRVDVELTANSLREAQALELARSGIEVTVERIKTARAAGQNTTALTDDTMSYTSEDLGLPLQFGTFSIRVSDEAGKLDVNTAEQAELLAVVGDEDLTAAILHWRGGGVSTTLTGPQYYYEEGDPPYSERSGRYRSIGELALVQGMTSQALWGDVNYLYTERQVGDVRGLSDLLTVLSIDSDLAADGTARTNLNTASADDLQNRLSNIVADPAVQALLQYRQQNSGNSAPNPVIPTNPDLTGGGGAPGGPVVPGPGSAAVSGRGTVRGRQVGPGRGGGGTGGGGAGGGAGGAAPGGIATPGAPAATGATGATTTSGPFDTTGSLVNVPGLADQDIQAMWDVVTADTSDVSEGRVNINTASLQVLTALLGDTIAPDVVRWRESKGPFLTVADLLSVSPDVRTVFEIVSSKLTTRSYILTIESTGHVDRTGIVKRVRATVDISGDRPNILWQSDY